jgi:hypothetical protein
MVMSDKAGVWIDHRKAVIVVLGPGADHTALVVSHVEKDLRRSGDSPLKGRYEARQVPRDDRRQMALTAKLDRYYDAVVAAVRNIDTLLLFGPGEAKGELKKRLEKNKLGKRIAAVQTVDKMTDRQIAAKVRAFFQASVPSA